MGKRLYFFGAVVLIVFPVLALLIENSLLETITAIGGAFVGLVACSAGLIISKKTS